MRRTVFVVFVAAFVGTFAMAQVSPDCVSAIPICDNTPVNAGTDGYGVDDFDGAFSSGCLEQTATGAIESNSAWYRFRTGASGQLGFNIEHQDNEDWDFALYLSDDCDDLGEPVRCNFFDNRDRNSYIGVGEDPTGANSVQYEEWLMVEPGQDYYLLINNFSNINSGFSIQFSGQIFVTNPYDALDCSIIDNLLGPPIAACDGDSVTLDATTEDALGYAWFANTGNGFEPLPSVTQATADVTSEAVYRVQVSLPMGTTLISDVQVSFTPSPITNPIGDVTNCYELNATFDLSAKDVEALGAQSDDDFMVSYHLTLADAQNGLLPVDKDFPLSSGSQTIFVRTTSMANPDCYDAGEQFEILTVSSPVMDFETAISICDDGSSAVIGPQQQDPTYTYAWDSGETTPSIAVDEAGSYTLTVSHSAHGIQCSSQRTVEVSYSLTPAIARVRVNDLQSNNTVTIETDQEGDFEYRLDEGAFQSDNTFEGVLPGTHQVTVRDTFGCGEVTDEIVVVGFLNHFSPNGDVMNENWHIEGLSYLQDAVVTIYDRYGQLITQLTEFTSGWDGTMNGQPLPATDYWFKISYINIDGNRTYAKYLQNHFSLRR
ncbi:MAG: T9SS type B sorting domain-containing protein [Flavobacteriaceae bacterium]|nr:T9SS type B sorting domain-containing protein [Flavobacteriaceae bacterium]